jgi:hypothetical protein
MKHANVVLGIVSVLSLGVIGIASYLLLQASGTVPVGSNVATNASTQTGIAPAPEISTKNDLKTTSKYLNSLNIDSAYNSETTQLNEVSN